MLTERIVRDAKPGPKPMILWDRQLTGLGCKLFPSGHKAYVLSYRTGRRKRLATLGPCAELSLCDARDLAREELAQIRRGSADPLERRRRAREAPTVNDALTKFFDETVPQRIAAGRFSERTAREYTWQARRYSRARVRACARPAGRARRAGRRGAREECVYPAPPRPLRAVYTRCDGAAPDAPAAGLRRGPPWLASLFVGFVRRARWYAGQAGLSPPACCQHPGLLPRPVAVAGTLIRAARCRRRRERCLSGVLPHCQCVRRSTRCARWLSSQSHVGTRVSSRHRWFSAEILLRRIVGVPPPHLSAQR